MKAARLWTEVESLKLEAMLLTSAHACWQEQWSQMQHMQARLNWNSVDYFSRAFRVGPRESHFEVGRFVAKLGRPPVRVQTAVHVPQAN